MPLEAGPPAPCQAFERETEKVRACGEVTVSMRAEPVFPARPEFEDAVIRRVTHV